jgi:hypothetical protein
VGRFYSVTLPETAITAAADLFELTAAADKPIRIWGWNIGQDTDVGDAAEEVLQLQLKRGVTAGSGGSSITPVAMDANGAAASATCANRTTAHTSGSILVARSWNIRVPEDFWFLPEVAPVIAADDDPVVLWMSAPADSITVSGSLIFEEVV